MAACLTLYGTPACTLCDRAAAIVRPVAEAFGWRLELCDVVEDDALFERYAERVPVLVRSDVSEPLCWPFDTAAVGALLSRATQA